MNRGTTRRSRLLVVTGSAIVIALGSVAACVTNLSYRYDPNAEGGTSNDGGRRDSGPSGSCTRVLLIGGNKPDGGAPIGVAFYGALSTGQVHWTVAPMLPYASAGGGALLVGDRVVIAGGSPHRTKHTAFAASTWRPAQTLPSRGGTGCTMGSLRPGEVHLLCGNDDDPDGGFPSAFYGPDNGNDVLWTDVTTTSNQPQPGGVSVPIGDQWLVVAPGTGVAQLGKPRTDPRTIDWTTATSRPGLPAGACAVSVENRAYFIGGDGSASVELAVLAGGTLTWSSDALPLPEMRAGAACLYAQGRIWVFGGADNPGRSTDSVYSARVTASGIDPEGWVLAKERLQNPVFAAQVACVP